MATWQEAQRDLVSGFAPGVLSKRQVLKLAEVGIITGMRGPPDPSSIDLSVAAGNCWKMRKGAVKPHKEEPYGAVLSNADLAERLELKDGIPFVMKQHQTYVFEIEQSLKLPLLLYAHATGRSTLGRLDILARLIGDLQPKYDQVDPPFEGKLYVEVTPITFEVSILPQNTICQLRLFKGHPSRNRVSCDDLELYRDPIVNYDQDSDEGQAELRVATNEDPLVKASAFRAKDSGDRPIIPIGAKPKTLDPHLYWEPIPPGGDRVTIERSHFYILRSVERFRLPKDIAVYAVAMHESLGEMRIHYAGFVHPQFGLTQERGTPLIFEIRVHDAHVILRQDEVLARLQYFRMSELSDEAGVTDYEKQELKLAKCFKDWTP